ncbi:hypothetical protein [Frondihabitans cladoniiphilus]|uniref:Pyrroloquinoline-quinone binding quinoprotein n=1 Tax=Frondihabitans cladoniiphilus TaxID=715785 RepID=A0ABP8VLT5_9MICO
MSRRLVALPPVGGTPAGGTPAGSTPSARRRVRRRRRRLSPGRRVVAAFAALVAVVLAVTGVAASLTPPYGDDSPWMSSRVDDVRQAPTAVGWSVDLARAMLPGVPTRCAGFGVSSSSGSLVLLVGQPPSLGSNAGCSTTTIFQVRSTVALLDTATGVVRWSTNLATAFDAAGGSAAVGSTSLSASAGRAVVEFTLGSRFLLTSLDLESGTAAGRLDLGASNVGVTALFEGGLALFGGSTSREGSTAWTLVDVRHVDRPIWRGVLADQNTPVLTPVAAFAVLSGRSVRIDGTSGRVASFGGGAVPLDSASSAPDGSFVTTELVNAGPVLTAWSADGTSLWNRGGVGSYIGSSRDCTLVSLLGTTDMSCLDSRTGRTRWTADVGTATRASGVPGQTDDSVYAYRSRGDRSSVLVLDGATGAARFTLDLAPLTYIDASARTMAYRVTYTASGTATDVAGFDTRSGVTLWDRPAFSGGDTELWGGHLVHLSGSGRTEQLTNRAGPVLGG